MLYHFGWNYFVVSLSKKFYFLFNFLCMRCLTAAAIYCGSDTNNAWLLQLWDGNTWLFTPVQFIFEGTFRISTLMVDCVYLWDPLSSGSALWTVYSIFLGCLVYWIIWVRYSHSQTCRTRTSVCVLGHLIVLSQPFCVPFSVLIPRSNLLYCAESLPLWSSPLFLGDENISLSANDEEEASKV